MMINNFVAMLLIARLGHAELAAGALVTSISTLLMVTGMSILYALGIIIGHGFGANKTNELGETLRSGAILSIIISLPIIVIMWNIGPILHLLKQPQSLINLTQQYFRALSWSVLPILWNVCFSQFVIAINKPSIILIFNCLRPLIMLPIGYCMLFGAFGFPRIGMAGIAYANVIMAYMMLLAGIIYLLAHKNLKPYKIFTLATRHHLKQIKQILKIGWPISMQFCAELLSFVVSTIFMGWLGEQTLEAAQIVMQLKMIVVMIPLGLSQTAGILIGQALGRDEKYFTKMLANASMIIGLGCLFIVSIVYLLAPKILIHFYLDTNNLANYHIMHIAILLLAVAAFTQLFDGARNIITGALRGFKDTKTPMWVGILITWVIGVPLSYIFAFPLHGGAVGVSLGYTAGFIIGAAVLTQRFYGKFTMQIAHP